MKYNGMELEEVKEPQVFDAPREMLAWGSGYPTKRMIVAILPGGTAVDIDRNWLSHCAYIPEKAAMRRVTNRELSRWCAEGKGQIHYVAAANAHSFYSYQHEADEAYVTADIKVRKWDDADWNEPTADYLELEGK